MLLRFVSKGVEYLIRKILAGFHRHTFGELNHTIYWVKKIIEFKMRIGCYIDQFYPQVAIDSLLLLKKNVINFIQNVNEVCLLYLHILCKL